MSNNTNNNNNNSNNDSNNDNNNNEAEWYETLDDSLNLPSSSPLKYDSVNITDKYGIDTSTVDLVVYFFVFAAIISMVFLYFRANGYSLGNFLKGLHKHMYVVGKGPTKVRTTSVKKVIIPNS